MNCIVKMPPMASDAFGPNRPNMFPLSIDDFEKPRAYSLNVIPTSYVSLPLNCDLRSILHYHHIGILKYPKTKENNVWQVIANTTSATLRP
jgi:hypothetical protein